MHHHDLKRHIESMVSFSRELAGHLTQKEAAFLAVQPFHPLPGEILEIGSFKGKSTIILAKSLQAAGGVKMHACDPLSLPSETDPTDAARESLPDIFRQNLIRHGVSEIVDFHQMKSTDLAKTWNLPLRLLWIDGDHTYTGATQDVRLFEPHLVPGAVLCLHDVLHEHEGPIRAFIENILLSGRYGDCGICGSIAWGQYVGDRGVSPSQWKTKLSLYRRLSPLVPYVVRWSHDLPGGKLAFQMLRSLVPHGKIEPIEWLKRRVQWQIHCTS